MSGLSSRKLIAEAKLEGSLGGTNSPVSFGITQSMHPGTSVVMIGRPDAAASHRNFERPSR